MERQTEPSAPAPARDDLGHAAREVVIAEEGDQLVMEGGRQGLETIEILQPFAIGRGTDGVEKFEEGHRMKIEEIDFTDGKRRGGRHAHAEQGTGGAKWYRPACSWKYFKAVRAGGQA